MNTQQAPVQNIREDFLVEYFKTMALLDARDILTLFTGNFIFTMTSGPYRNRSTSERKYLDERNGIKIDHQDGRGWFLIEPVYVDVKDLPMSIDPSEKRVKSFDLTIAEHCFSLLGQKVDIVRVNLVVDSILASNDAPKKEEPLIEGIGYGHGEEAYDPTKELPE